MSKRFGPAQRVAKQAGGLVVATRITGKFEGGVSLGAIIKYCNGAGNVTQAQLATVKDGNACQAGLPGAAPALPDGTALEIAMLKAVTRRPDWLATGFGPAYRLEGILGILVRTGTAPVSERVLPAGGRRKCCNISYLMIL